MQDDMYELIFRFELYKMNNLGYVLELGTVPVT